MVAAVHIADQKSAQKLLNNVAANYAGTLLSVALPLLTLPLYLNHLGSASWGLVSFVTFFVSTLSILDSGCSQALMREFASRVGVKPEEIRRSADLLFGYERVYVGFASVVVLLALPMAGTIGTRWLNLGDLPEKLGCMTVYCALGLFFVQFPGSIYRTVLSARQQQVRLNKIQMCFVLLRHFIGVTLVMVQPAITVYLIWQVLCTGLETIYMSNQAWREVGRSRSESEWDRVAMKTTIRFAAVMAVSVLLGAATNMMDKFYITARLPIAELGYYGIASSVSFGLLRLSYPIFTAVLPRLTQLSGDKKSTSDINVRLLVASTAGLGLFFVLYLGVGKAVLGLWLRNDAVAANVVEVLNLLLIGSALNIYYNIGYTNWVATGKSRVIFRVNLASFLVALIVTPLAIDRFGLVGAGAALVLMNAIGACVSLYWLAKSRVDNR
jgi:O-antigen/teichoic acid export membrane protein